MLMSKQESGVLLVNLGTPDTPTAPAVKRFLRNFLSDRRVVDTPIWIWWPILRFFILPFRSPKVSKLYSSIWMEEGSPLMVYSQRQRNALQKKLDLPVALGMSYGQPSLDSAISTLIKRGVTKLTVLPLYPQFSSSTVSAVWDGLHRVFKKVRFMPEIRFIRDYADHPSYIDALRLSVMRSFSDYGKPDLLVLSYHGIPQRYADEGDDYPNRCAVTTRLLTHDLGLPNNQVAMTFQSRFGREPWLQPYTDETMKSLAKQGVRHVQVMSPGFSSDCLETLEEINGENREIFLASGGEKFEYIPALNDDDAHIEMMAKLVIS
jgi:ferrochelatase